MICSNCEKTHTWLNCPIPKEDYKPWLHNSAFKEMMERYDQAKERWLERFGSVDEKVFAEWFGRQVLRGDGI